MMHDIKSCKIDSDSDSESESELNYFQLDGTVRHDQCLREVSWDSGPKYDKEVESLDLIVTTIVQNEVDRVTVSRILRKSFDATHHFRFFG